MSDELPGDFNKSTISLFPNPSSGLLEFISYKFKSASREQAIFKLYNLFGEKIFVQSIPNIADEREIFEFNIDKLNLPSGIYLFNITKDAEVLSSKVVINK